MEQRASADVVERVARQAEFLGNRDRQPRDSPGMPLGLLVAQLQRLRPSLDGLVVRGNDLLRESLVLG